MTLTGKGCFIWKIQNCEGGDPQAIAAVARQAGFTHVLLKVADGSYSYNFDNEGELDLAEALVGALRATGIEAWGWHYIYGDGPLAESRKAIQRVRGLGLDGYVIDVEAPYKKPGRWNAARLFMREVRSALDDIPIALSSYRFPSYHPQIPWQEFLEGCDILMPQVYFEFSHNPEAQLQRTQQEYQALAHYLPIVPTGPVYRRGSWTPTTEDISNFLQTARQLNMPAANFWEWSRVRAEPLAPLWQTVREYEWGAGSLPQDLLDRYLLALNTQAIDQLMDLYISTAVHVSSARTRVGQDAIRSWYQSLFNSTLPGATYTLTGRSGGGSLRHFTWTAISPRGQVRDGSDFIGLFDGRIVYHYTAFTVSPAFSALPVSL
ncbi:MAG TPA: nuclear transport factor 2 family protein [Anaerolineales bacterium]|nr:nuclear transport factor 2 family protein [Anaerolineales bacterium]